MATTDTAETNEQAPATQDAEKDLESAAQDTLTAVTPVVEADSDSKPVQPLHPVPEYFPEVGDLSKPPAKQSDSEVTVPGAPATPTVSGAPVQPTVAAAAVSATAQPAAVQEDPHSVHDAYRSYQPERNVCVRCGSSNLAHGYVVDYSEKFRQSYFAPKRVSLGRLNSLLALRPFRSLAKLDAVACRDCGAVLLMVDPSELRRAEHHRGE